MSIVNTDVDEIEHAVKDNAEAMFTWDYTLARPQLRKLYEKGKVGQWNAATDLPWDTEVDFEKVVREDESAISAGLSPDHYDGTVVEKWTDDEWIAFAMDQRRWTLSQFLHGEQGALLCTAKITESVPWYDAKLYAATQVVDEARHVEVFSRYLQEKVGGEFQVNAHLRLLLDDIINDSRWDMTYLGMQVMVEGLALAAFGFMHQLTGEPLLKQLLRYVMSDEARHVAFGVLSLREVYAASTDAEIKERQEFAYEAAVRMRDRFLSQEVWERHGVNPRDVVPLVLNDPTRQLFQTMLFSKIVPNCKKLGLLDRNDSVAAPPLRGDGRHPVREPRGHRRGVREFASRRRNLTVARRARTGLRPETCCRAGRSASEPLPAPAGLEHIRIPDTALWCEVVCWN